MEKYINEIEKFEKELNRIKDKNLPKSIREKISFSVYINAERKSWFLMSVNGRKETLSFIKIVIDCLEELLSDRELANSSKYMDILISIIDEALTTKKIKEIMESGLQEENRQTIIDCDNNIIIVNNPLNTVLSKVISCPSAIGNTFTKINPTVKTDRKGNYKIDYDDFSISIRDELINKISGKVVKNNIKLFRYIVSQMVYQKHTAEPDQYGYQILKFPLSDIYSKFKIYSNEDTAYRGLKKFLTLLREISIDFVRIYDGKRQVGSITSGIVNTFLVSSFGNCVVPITPNLIKEKDYYVKFPDYFYSLETNYATLLMDCIVRFMRLQAQKKSIKEKEYFDIRLETVRREMGLKSPDEAGSRHEYYIKSPIYKAIEEIKEKQEEWRKENNENGGFELELLECNGNINEFLSGKLRVYVKGSTKDNLIEYERKKKNKIEKRSDVYM